MGAAPALSGQRSILQAALTGAAAPTRSDRAIRAEAMVFMAVLRALGFTFFLPAAPAFADKQIIVLPLSYGECKY
jgi:hypothetical protein